jgi:CheY-like chemotaxis protein
MLKILLIEDNKVLKLANERILSKAGYTVIWAGDGEEALRQIYVERPHLVLLDMMLPKVSGPDVLRALKRDPLTASIPVVVLTGLSQKNEQKLKAEGAAAFIEKSWLIESPQSLLDTIQSVLTLHSAQSA